MGSAVMAHLADRGLRVIGIDRHDVPNDRGSSHGESRVIRTAYFEDPRYVPLLQRAWQLWELLGAQVREPLLVETGCLNFGAPDHEGVLGAERAAVQHSLRYEKLDAAAIAARFPALRPNDGDVGIFERQGGVLAPEACVAGHVMRAVRDGRGEVRTRERVTSIKADRDSVVVTTERERYEAAACVVATGAWLAAPDSPVRIPLPLWVERQVQCWFQVSNPAAYEVGALPCWVRFDGDATFYGMPRHEYPGVKVCRHHGGAPACADDLDRTISAQDEETVRSFVRRHLPGADGPLLAGRVCMYTNTPDGHFAVGRHPEHERVFVCGGFSGHGFKFAPVIGEAIADLVVDGRTKLPIELFDPGRAHT